VWSKLFARSKSIPCDQLDLSCDIGLYTYRVGRAGCLQDSEEPRSGKLFMSLRLHVQTDLAPIDNKKVNIIYVNYVLIDR